jgi:hypothetical protein
MLLGKSCGRGPPARVGFAIEELRSTRSSIYIAIRFLTSSVANPDTRITFLRLLWPEAMVTEERGTFKSFAKNVIQASFALPSIGGEVRETFSVPSSSPVIAFFLARG